MPFRALAVDRARHAEVRALLLEATRIGHDQLGAGEHGEELEVARLRPQPEALPLEEVLQTELGDALALRAAGQVYEWQALRTALQGRQDAGELLGPLQQLEAVQRDKADPVGLHRTGITLHRHP